MNISKVYFLILKYISSNTKKHPKPYLGYDLCIYIYGVDGSRENKYILEIGETS